MKISSSRINSTVTPISHVARSNEYVEVSLAMSDELFETCARPEGDLAGVFEYDGEVGYFYLCDLTRKDGETILGAIHVTSAKPDFIQSEIKVVWNKSRDVVGLSIRGRIWAAFSISGEKFGGSYNASSKPRLPSDIVSNF
jgi:hypothetical protein